MTKLHILILAILVALCITSPMIIGYIVLNYPPTELRTQVVLELCAADVLFMVVTYYATVTFMEREVV